MANVKKGQLTTPPQWWRHLRDWKRVFWKRERKAAQSEIREEAAAAEKNVSQKPDAIRHRFTLDELLVEMTPEREPASEDDGAEGQEVI